MSPNQLCFMIGHAGVEVVRADECTQGEVSFQRSAWRADPDHSAIGDPFVQIVPCRGNGSKPPFQQGLAETSLTVDEFVAKPSAVAQEVAVHFVVIAVDDAAQRPIAFACIHVAAESAVHANRRSELLVPLASIVVLQGFIREHACGADFHQVAAEFILQNAIFGTAEENRVPQRKRVQIVAASIVAIVAHAAVTLDAAIHFVIHQRTQVLIAKRALVEFVTAIIVTGHHSHILQVTFAALIAHRAVVRMIQHESLDNAGAESGSLRIIDGDPGAFRGGRHAGHDDFALLIVLVLELFDGTLAAGAHRSQRRMPAEVRQLEALRKTPVEQVLLRIHLARFVINVNGRHTYLHGQRCSLMCRSKSSAKIFHCALQRLRGAGRQCTECIAGTPHVGLELELVEVAGLPAALLHRLENPLRPSQSAPAGRAEAAGFAREKMGHVPGHADRTGLVIEHDHGAGAHAAAGFRHLGEIHGRVQVLLDDERRRGPTWQQSAKLHTVAHSPGMLLENFAQGGADGQFPKPGTLYFSAHAE